MTIRHALWATPPVPVPTGRWRQEDWNKFYEAYRPTGYTGAMDDEKAYNKWVATYLLDKLVGPKYDQEVPPITNADVSNYRIISKKCRCGTCIHCCVAAEVERRKKRTHPLKRVEGGQTQTPKTRERRTGLV